VPRPVTEAWAPRRRRFIARFGRRGPFVARDHVGARARLAGAAGLAILAILLNRRLCHAAALTRRNGVLFFVAHSTRF
jgi:hypothetical protein